ncbi:hypothetical protein G6F48_003282 [Rhizopus delemar]|nr:hypothetical protein G6F48_003282 [Rhizopus delemar]
MSIQGFWGLQLEPEKTYSQVVTAPFRITMASLSVDIADNKRSSVSVLIDKKEFVLCTLVPNKIEQQPLDITFVEGEEITFSAKGRNSIHLTGNYLFQSDEGEDMDSIDLSDEDSVAEYLQKLPPNASKEEINRALIASLKGESEVYSDSDEEVDYEIESDDEETNSGEETNSDEDEEEIDYKVNTNEVSDDLEDDLDDIEEPVSTTKKRASKVLEKPLKKQKTEKKEEPKKEKPKKEETKKEETKKEEIKKDHKKEKPKKEKPKKEEHKKEEQRKEEHKKEEHKKDQSKKEEFKKKTKLPNGLIIEDVKIGEGSSCKNGQKIGMRYIGKLTNGKIFDKNISGKPFYFLLGRGEVIKGWDLGIADMKAGGERRLTIPAPLAYGKRGIPPDIPKNATLVFDVKLLSMK